MSNEIRKFIYIITDGYYAKYESMYIGIVCKRNPSV